ncbi:hypothetical protein BS329_35315 [Amycolatopsis coloradensis]|uniref:Uncharacterized protein n=1 Tax=Amycolatopsis coloradensis TaxID=76021 RepID=A0A1R0KHA3_9PSEU|nr:hypothetical protein [Amycolatopsis coloradensis]OLZ45022.1 hypothetical protein BS329_35315 [Amycolatopsis coloradensis]
MLTYLRAYRLGELRAFEELPALAAGDDDVVFLCADLSVRELPFADAPVLFDGRSPGWARFCRDRLAFAEPDWATESAHVRSAVCTAVSGEPSATDDQFGVKVMNPCAG